MTTPKFSYDALQRGEPLLESIDIAFWGPSFFHCAIEGAGDVKEPAILASFGAWSQQTLGF